jgi:hypothetical protein
VNSNCEFHNQEIVNAQFACRVAYPVLSTRRLFNEELNNVLAVASPDKPNVSLVTVSRKATQLCINHIASPTIAEKPEVKTMADPDGPLHGLSTATILVIGIVGNNTKTLPTSGKSQVDLEVIEIVEHERVSAPAPTRSLELQAGVAGWPPLLEFLPALAGMGMFQQIGQCCYIRIRNSLPHVEGVYQYSAPECFPSIGDLHHINYKNLSIIIGFYTFYPIYIFDMDGVHGMDSLFMIDILSLVDMFLIFVGYYLLFPLPLYANFSPVFMG